MSFNKFLNNLGQDYFFNMTDLDKMCKFKPLIDNYKLCDGVYFYFNMSSKLWVEQKTEDSVIHNICDFTFNILGPEEQEVNAILADKSLALSSKKKDDRTADEEEKLKEVQQAMKDWNKFIKATIKDHQKAKFAKSVINFFNHHIIDEDFKNKININNHNLLPLKTMNLNLQTLTMQERVKNQYFTKCLDFYDLKDLSENDEAFKTVDKFFLDICTGYEPKKQYLQKILGYFLTGAVPLGRTFYIFYGEGKNGKSALFEVLGEVMKHYVRPVESSIIVKRGKKNAGQASPEMEVLDYGLRLAILSETEEGEKLNESLIKNISGYDPISYRGLRKDEKEFRCEAKLVLLTNHKPQFEFSQSMIDRLRFTAFNSRFISCTKEQAETEGYLKPGEYRQDPELIKELKTIYRQHVLLWCAMGAQRFFKDGHMNIPDDEKIKLENMSYINEMDSYSRFKNDCLFIDQNEKVMSSTINKAYKEFCESEFIPAIKLSCLKKLIEKEFGGKHKISNDYYFGFTLNSIKQAEAQQAEATNKQSEQQPKFIDENHQLPDPSGIDYNV